MLTIGASLSKGSVKEVHVPVEHVTNGTFDSDISGWTDASTGTGSISWSSGSLQLSVGITSGNSVARQQVTGLEIGRSYNWSATSTGNGWSFRIATTSGGTDIVHVTVSGGTTESGSFTATTTSVWVDLVRGTQNGSSNADDISIFG